MPRDQHTMTLTDDAYTEVTAGAATAMTLIVVSGRAEFRATGDANPPAASAKGVPMIAGDGVLNTAIADIFSASGMTRVWGKARGEPCEIYIDHASA